VAQGDGISAWVKAVLLEGVGLPADAAPWL
jgi:hypothetical protein